MGKHAHNHCSHDLKYCEQCDAVYCTKCDREWMGHSHYIWYYYGTPYRVYWGEGKNSYTITTTAGDTVTDKNVITYFNSTYGNDKGYSDTVNCYTSCTHNN